jgi:hypothetical protein
MFLPFLLAILVFWESLSFVYYKLVSLYKKRKIGKGKQANRRITNRYTFMQCRRYVMEERTLTKSTKWHYLSSVCTLHKDGYVGRFFFQDSIKCRFAYMACLDSCLTHHTFLDMCLNVDYA